MTKNTVRHGLLDLERAGWDSLCNQTGSEYYGELMLPNALMVLANGIAKTETWWFPCSPNLHRGAHTILAMCVSSKWTTATLSWSTPAPHTARPTSQPSLVRCRVPITAPTLVGSSRCVSRRRSPSELLDAT